MDQATHNKIVSFIWGIADDVLRDLFRRGKYPDVILPMCVLRRMDAVLEPTKQAVLDTKQMLDGARITEQRAALADAAGQAFYNTSRFTLRDLKSRGSHQQLLADFEDYLNGFSPNVQDILDNFKFRNQLTTLSKADALGTLINKFLDPDIDLSPAGIAWLSMPAGERSMSESRNLLISVPSASAFDSVVSWLRNLKLSRMSWTLGEKPLR